MILACRQCDDIFLRDTNERPSLCPDCDRRERWYVARVLLETLGLVAVVAAGMWWVAW